MATENPVAIFVWLSSLSPNVDSSHENPVFWSFCVMFTTTQGSLLIDPFLQGNPVNRVPHSTFGFIAQDAEAFCAKAETLGVKGYTHSV